jgi:hypothetical protein
VTAEGLRIFPVREVLWTLDAVGRTAVHHSPRKSDLPFGSLLDDWMQANVR